MIPEITDADGLDEMQWWIVAFGAHVPTEELHRVNRVSAEFEHLRQVAWQARKVIVAAELQKGSVYQDGTFLYAEIATLKDLTGFTGVRTVNVRNEELK